MNLRLRLIVAFFLLSVVPLAAVTLVTYTTSAQALREAAGREAELLAGELSQRMQVVTAQLSERVGHLMDVAEARAEAELANSRLQAAAEPPRQTAPPAAPPAPQEVQVAQALGEMALLLNNIELRGVRGPRRGEGPPPGAAPPGGAPPQRVGGNGGRSGRGFPPRDQRDPRPGPVPGAGPSPPAVPTPPTDAVPSPAAVPPSSMLPAGTRDPKRLLESAAPPDPDAAPRDRILIDVGPMRRDIIRQVVPEGQWEKLTDEERRRIMGEVNQRMLGIAQGIQLGAAEAQKRVAEAQRAADTKAQAAAKAVQTPPKSPPPPNSRVAASTSPARRKTALSGSRLDVTVERDGKVVRTANAEVNLPNLLATVLMTTRRDRGEIPFAVGKDGRLYTPTEEDRGKIEALGVARSDAPAGTTRLNDWIVVATPDPTGSGLRFGIARPLGDSLGDLQRTSARNAALGLAFIGLALVGMVPISSRLTRNLSRLSDGVHRIAQGDYGARVDVRTHDEIGRLATAFNQMAADVEVHQRSAVEQERIKRELELGRQIQHDMLPQAPLRLGLTEIKGVSVPAREVGGDFFNYFSLADGRIALLVGDVSGKGVGAALLMANIQASLRTRLALGQDLAALARELDLDIEDNTRGPLYATLFVGILDPVSRELSFVNAGHNPQYILRGVGTLEERLRPERGAESPRESERGWGPASVEKMTASGLPVGLLAGHGYNEARVRLASGDTLFLYTDGCVEAENDAGDMFGAERLEQLLVSAAGTDDLLARVEAVIAAFRGGREPFDDATMMVVKIG